jgi:nitrite reductase/ring-hydroxylating ferredoxin subunit
MKIKKILSLFILLLTFSLLTFNSSCSERNETVSCFPNATVSVQLNLSLPSNNALQNVGGWIYVNEVGAGTRGLIVVRITSGFKVYDRNAPHICPDTDTTLEVKNGTSVYCPKDKAEWILITGQPTAVANVSPKTYGYSFDSNSNILSIYN